MKDYILSLRPKWAQLILDGEKVLEIRKTAPLVLATKDSPLRVWVYETKNGGGCGKIVGMFLCPGIESVTGKDFCTAIRLILLSKKSRLSVQELRDYKGTSQRLFAWQVTEPRRLQAPVELSTIFPSRCLPPQSWAKAPAEPAIEVQYEPVPLLRL